MSLVNTSLLSGIFYLRKKISCSSGKTRETACPKYQFTELTFLSLETQGLELLPTMVMVSIPVKSSGGTIKPL